MKVYLKSRELKKILIKKNKSQNWFAYRLEISSGYMSQLMDGSRSPSPRLREKIMNYLPDHQFDDLFLILENENEKGHIKENRSLKI